ncbi:methyltransferase [Streptomyces sp. NPDC059009]|uniref:methyltransferase n=1 Tax=Streptomyces sp. NPDC059009 TaxID=3346694 RepID=UPI0036CCA4A3
MANEEAETAADSAGTAAAGNGGEPGGGGAGWQQLAQILFGGLAAQTVRAAVQLGIVERFGGKERTAAELAAEADAQPQGMTRLLRALAGLGLLREREPGTFAVTEAGAYLDPGHPESVTALVGIFADPTMTRAWEHLADSVRTGETAFDTVYGTDFFSHLKEHPELSAQFNTAMSQATRSTAEVLPQVYDFGRFGTVTDVGGGDGTLLAAVLRQNPGLTGVVYDTEEGLAQAPETLRRHGLDERCALVAGDFFASVPEGADAYLIKSILHDWPDDRVVTILRHCSAVLPPEGRVLIVEPVLPEVVAPDRPGFSYLSDLNMLANVSGRERTRADFDEVCRQAGLTIVSVTPVPAPSTFCLIEAALT